MLKTDNIDVNKLFNPKYSAPITLINTVRVKNGNISIAIFSINPQIMFLDAFFVLSISNFSHPVHKNIVFTLSLYFIKHTY